jgi:hypothetical protein
MSVARVSTLRFDCGTLLLHPPPSSVSWAGVGTDVQTDLSLNALKTVGALRSRGEQRLVTDAERFVWASWIFAAISCDSGFHLR